MSKTYIITDHTTGHSITEGVQAHEIDRIAQEIATDRGEAVLVTPVTYDADGERIDDEANEYVVRPEQE